MQVLHQDKPKGQQQGIWNSAHIQWGKKKLQSFITSSYMESFYVAWIKIKSRLWDMVIGKQKVVVDLSEGLWGKLPWSYPTSYYPRSGVPSFFVKHDDMTYHGPFPRTVFNLVIKYSVSLKQDCNVSWVISVLSYCEVLLPLPDFISKLVAFLTPRKQRATP